MDIWAIFCPSHSKFYGTLEETLKTNSIIFQTVPE